MPKALDDTSSCRIAYLLSQYPTFTHTFLLREVIGLRNAGVVVDVAAVKMADRPIDQLPQPERSEAERTFYIAPKGIARQLLSAARWLVGRPVRTGSAILLALRCAGGNPRRLAAHAAYLLQAAVLAEWLSRNRATRLHCHFATSVAMLAAVLHPIDWSMTLHGPAEFDDVLGFSLAEKVARAHKVIAISQYAKSQILRAVPPALWEKVEVVRLGVSMNEYEPPAGRRDSEPLTLLTVGRLAPVKGHHALLGAVRLLKDDGVTVNLRIVGDGPLREELAAAVDRLGLAESVTLLGAREQREVTELYRTADVFVLSSFAEGVPVVLMEAMAMELPCIATRIMGVPELILDGRDGVLVNPADERDLARGIRQLVSDSTARIALGKAARAKVAAEYSLPRNLSLLASVLCHRD